MSDVKRLMELSGIDSSKYLAEYVNGGKLDKILVVCNPRQGAESCDDCVKEVTPKELFMMAKGEDCEALNPTFYYASATGAARKDAKERFEAMQTAMDKAEEAEELAKQAAEAQSAADEAARAAGIMQNDAPHHMPEEVGDELNVPAVDEVESGEAAIEEPKPEEEEVASDVQSVEKVEEMFSSGSFSGGSSRLSRGRGGLSAPLGIRKDRKLDDKKSEDDEAENKDKKKAKKKEHVSEEYDVAVMGDDVANNPAGKKEESEKTTIESGVLKDLNQCIKDHKAQADHYTKMKGYNDQAAFCDKVVEVAEKIKHMLECGEQKEFDEAVVFFSSLMGPLQNALPVSLSKCLHSGGRTGRTLKDYFVNVRKGK